MITIVPEYEEQEYDDMGSFNHSVIQANLAYLLKSSGDYSVAIELSLDTSGIDLSEFHVRDELKPDVCIYPKRPLSLPYDILKMREMPPLIIEVLSPRQGILTIIEKFGAYFELGVDSCWLVDPITQTVHVYSSPTQRTTFTEGTVSDPIVNIELAIAAIFD